VVENPQFAVRTVIPSAIVSDVLMNKCFLFWRPHCHFRLSVVVAIARGQFLRTMGVVENPTYAIGIAVISVILWEM